MSCISMPPGIDHDQGRQTNPSRVIFNVSEGGGDAERTDEPAGDSGHQEGTQEPAEASRTEETAQEPQEELNRWPGRWQELKREGFGEYGKRLEDLWNNERGGTKEEQPAEAALNEQEGTAPAQDEDNDNTEGEQPTESKATEEKEEHIKHDRQKDGQTGSER